MIFAMGARAAAVFLGGRGAIVTVGGSKMEALKAMLDFLYLGNEFAAPEEHGPSSTAPHAVHIVLKTFRTCAFLLAVLRRSSALLLPFFVFDLF